jgi:alpha-tubulin suppressor-like RCC1 family protein
MAIKTDYTMWGWGKNNQGNLAQEDEVYRSSPVQIGAGTAWWRVSCTQDSVSAVARNGTLWSWGGGGVGRLGTGAVINVSSPVQIGTDTDWYDVAGGFDTIQALK